MRLFGTTTSPFVRRVRVVAAEVGEPVDRVDTATDDGMAQLRSVSPIRKVPVAIIDERLIYDSRVIIDWLTTTRGWGRDGGQGRDGIEPPRDQWREQNLLNAIDAALDSVIQLFYLRRDGVAVDGTPYAQRQLERTDAILTWLARELSPQAFALPQISVCCALDWMDFRKVYPTERASGLDAVRAALRERPSMVATRPHA